MKYIALFLLLLVGTNLQMAWSLATNHIIEIFIAQSLWSSGHKKQPVKSINVTDVSKEISAAFKVGFMTLSLAIRIRDTV
jgi:hypothetical protein